MAIATKGLNKYGELNGSVGVTRKRSAIGCGKNTIFIRCNKCCINFKLFFFLKFRVGLNNFIQGQGILFNIVDGRFANKLVAYEISADGDGNDTDQTD